MLGSRAAAEEQQRGRQRGTSWNAAQGGSCCQLKILKFTACPGLLLPRSSSLGSLHAVSVRHLYCKFTIVSFVCCWFSFFQLLLCGPLSPLPVPLPMQLAYLTHCRVRVRVRVRLWWRLAKVSSVLCYLWLTAVSFLLSSRPRRVEESHWGSGSLWPSRSFSCFRSVVRSQIASKIIAIKCR